MLNRLPLVTFAHHPEKPLSSGAHFHQQRAGSTPGWGLGGGELQALRGGESRGEGLLLRDSWAPGKSAVAKTMITTLHKKNDVTLPVHFLKESLKKGWDRDYPFLVKLKGWDGGRGQGHFLPVLEALACWVRGRASAALGTLPVHPRDHTALGRAARGGRWGWEVLHAWSGPRTLRNLGSEGENLRLSHLEQEEHDTAEGRSVNLE